MPHQTIGAAADQFDRRQVCLFVGDNYFSLLLPHGKCDSNLFSQRHLPPFFLDDIY